MSKDALKPIDLTGILQVQRASKYLTSYQSNDGGFVENFQQGTAEIVDAGGWVTVMIVNQQGYNNMIEELKLDTPDTFHPFAGIFSATPIICITNHRFKYELCGVL